MKVLIVLFVMVACLGCPKNTGEVETNPVDSTSVVQDTTVQDSLK